MNVLEAEKLSFSYNDVPVFKDISFAVKEGNFTALIGANGAGKSTLLRVILGELEPSSGRISIFGQDLGKFHDWKKVAYVPQEGLTRKIDFPASVYEVVASGLYNLTGFGHFPSKKQKEMVYTALKDVGLSDYSKRMLSEISGGQRQRVLLARAILSEPKLMLLDEPLTGMDDESSRSFYDLLVKLNRERNLSILMISHDLERIGNYVSDVFCLEYGSIVHLSSKELLIEQEHRHTHIHVTEEA